MGVDFENIILFTSGMPICTSEYLTEPSSEPSRTHRKKRIRKKYLKQFGTTTVQVPAKNIVVIKNHGKKSILMHPRVFEEFKRKSDLEYRQIKLNTELPLSNSLAVNEC